MRLRAFCAVVLLLVATFPLSARDVSIRVEDAELGLPLEGAAIRSWDGAQYICNEDGEALVSVPDDRQVVISASYPGYENGRLAIPAGMDRHILGLRLSGIMENRELVIEASRPGSSETRTGRSVAVSGRDIAQTAEIGIIEDVISSIKLLPGVGYAGFFNAQPSIRGGDPGDMRASLDGFYILNPYHWGGGFSIFDPRMVESAQLSHGVFSSRYGHSISGLLDISSKEPSPTETEFALGANTSAANFNLSVPFAGAANRAASKGGVLFMGRITYYDPVVALAKQIAKVSDNETLQSIHAVETAPYIRSGTITGNYRFLDNLELRVTGFWGMDGIGVQYSNSRRGGALDSDSRMKLNWTNYQGFLSAGLSWNPRADMLLRFSTGVGYEKSLLDGGVWDTIHNKNYSETFKNYAKQFLTDVPESYTFNTSTSYKEYDTTFNTQGRVDYDWEPGKGFIVAAGVQEMFTRFSAKGDQHMRSEKWFGNFKNEEQDAILVDMGVNPADVDPVYYNFLRENLLVSVSVPYKPDSGNNLFTTSGYVLGEYTTPDNKLNTELGLHLDHYYLRGKGFSLSSKPALSPRLNIDYNIFKDMGIVRSFDIGAGTGLFASMNNDVSRAEKQYNIKELKPNRSWTSVLGSKLEFPLGLNINIEGYYKYIFDRMYVPIKFEGDDIDVRPRFNGEGKVWGIDMMLQKMQSRFWDGWISYSFNWAKYRNPNGDGDMYFSGGVSGDRWQFPSYHRFHNLNLVLNIKPAPRINIYTRFGLASGLQISKRVGDGPISYPVYVYDPENPGDSKFIEKFYWPTKPDENKRTTPSLPLDIKFSIFGGSKGKARYEIYVAVENALALLYSAQANTRYNSYTGEVDTGSDSASYELPIPIPSFGFTISY